MKASTIMSMAEWSFLMVAIYAKNSYLTSSDSPYVGHVGHHGVNINNLLYILEDYSAFIYLVLLVGTIGGLVWIRTLPVMSENATLEPLRSCQTLRLVRRNLQVC